MLDPAGSTSLRRAAAAGVLALVSLGAADYLGGLRHAAHHSWVVVALTAAFALLGAAAVRLAAGGLEQVSRTRAGASAASTTYLVSSIAGYLLILVGVLQLLSVNLSTLLVGGAITGVVIGIAAQQTIGGFFAGIVLLFARPYAIGQRIRVNSGAMGGPFDGVITGAGLLYTTMSTENGLLHLPNSALLSAAIGPVPTATGDPRTPQHQRPTEPVGDVD